MTNTEKNPKEECKTVMTRSKRFVEAEDEESVVHKKKGTDGKKNHVRGESNQEKEKQIMVKALINLGASINLMPLSMCRRLGEL